MNISTLEKNLKNLETIFDQFADVCDGHAKEIKNNKCTYTSAKVRAHFDSMQDRERLLKVGIIGRVKAGKSSLINSLLFNGKEILPKAATPMTAALTSIGYSEKFTAKVEFFSQDDLQTLRQKAESYELELDKCIAEQKEEYLKRQQQRSPNSMGQPAIDEARLHTMAQRTLDEREPTLKAAADLYGRVRRSSVNYNDLLPNQVLEAASEAELNKELYNYVGSEGKYMPFTKTLHIGLPLPSLNELLVVDTPGLNDAVASREQRTYEMLKECNVVFIVSPAGQFLNAQDLELAERLTKRDGIQEIYIVASQIDTQLHGSERQKHKGQLPEVIRSLQIILADQAASTLRNQDNHVLKAIAEHQKTRLFVTSGMCQTLLAQPAAEWDEMAQHTNQLLQKNYSDYFNAPEQRVTYLEMLAGRQDLLNTISKVHQQKLAIFEKQTSDFLKAQQTSIYEAVTMLTEHFLKKAKKIESTELLTATKRVEELTKIRNKGIKTTDNIFKDQIDELTYSLSNKLRASVHKYTDSVQSNMCEAEGSVTEVERREKDGILSGLARFFLGGGYENINKTYTTLNAHEVRRSLEKMHHFIEKTLLNDTKSHLNKWRGDLVIALISKLRDSVGDNHVDGETLNSACRTAVSSLPPFSDPQLSKLPSSLAKSGKLKGYEAESYIKDAGDYLSSLFRESNQYVETLLLNVNQVSNFDMGTRLFNSLQEETQQLLNMVENKRLSIDKLKVVAGKLQKLNHE